MAYQPRKIPVLDLQKSKGIGVKLPFNHSGVFETSYTTKEAVKTNLINFLLTGKGERFLNPTFGTGLRNQLFENINRDTLANIELQVKNDIQKFFPKVDVLELKVSSEIDAYTIYLFLKFSISNTDIQDELTISFEQ